MNIEHVLQIQIEGENYPSAGSRARQMFGTRAWVAEAGNGKLCSGQNFKNQFFLILKDLSDTVQVRIIKTAIF